MAASKRKTEDEDEDEKSRNGFPKIRGHSPHALWALTSRSQRR